jgi:hypothetical protein
VPAGRPAHWLLESELEVILPPGVRDACPQFVQEVRRSLKPEAGSEEELARGEYQSPDEIRNEPVEERFDDFAGIL